MKIKLIIGFVFFAITVGGILFVKEYTQRPPNVIIILADDLGYGDVGFNGQSKILTPNIDSLALNGLVFDQFYAGSTVCAPSRSTLLTGLHTGHTPIRGNIEMENEGQYPLPDSSLTLAEMFKSRGYATGVFGKWGLGYPDSEGDPLNQGFDTFFGYNCQRLAHNYYPFHIWDNTQKVMLDANKENLEGIYAPELIHTKTLEFIEKNKEKPFFLYVASPLPHAELKAPNPNVQKYIDRFDEIPYQGCDSGCKEYKNGWYGSQTKPHAVFAAMVDLLDQQVGTIVNQLRKNDLLENTVIIFTSDNGPHKEGGADPDFFNSNAGYRGYKRDLYEGGIRVPMVISWQGQIRPGESQSVGAFWDLLPTFADLIGYEEPFSTDGVSLMHSFYNQPNVKRDVLYWEFHTIYGKPAQALLLQERWKLIRKVEGDNFNDFELYDLKNDPNESIDMAISEPNRVKAALDTLDQMRVPSKLEEWNF